MLIAVQKDRLEIVYVCVCVRASSSRCAICITLLAGIGQRGQGFCAHFVVSAPSDYGFMVCHSGEFRHLSQ